MMGRKYWTAKDVARELGISKQTIIRYEEKGVFPKPKRNPVNGWREYTIEDVNRLKSILGRR